MPNYAADTVCGNCQYFGGNNGLCLYNPKYVKEKQWVNIEGRYTMREMKVPKYRHVAGSFGITSKCWRKQKAMEISKKRTGSEGNWKSFIKEVKNQRSL